MADCLIIDNSNLCRKLATIHAQHLDLEPVEASNAKEALMHCRKSMPDVIFLNWKMPGMDGIAFLNEFKQIKDSEETYVIMCTGKSRDSDKEQATKAGVNEYLVKPISLNMLKDALERCRIF